MKAFLYFKTQYFEWKEQKKVERLFYSNKRFQKLDRALLKAYRFKNPYLIAKTFLVQKGIRDCDAYGETPLTTMHRIVHECALGCEDVVIELGAGRGRAALFLAEFIRCHVVAYEWNPVFVQRMVHSPNLKMVDGDMFSADFSQATAVFLYGTMLSETEIANLALKFPLQCKIITVSYPLEEYSHKYRTIKSFPGVFPWGQTEVYWNERTC